MTDAEPSGHPSDRGPSQHEDTEGDAPAPHRVPVAHPRTLASLNQARPPAARRTLAAEDLGRQTPLGDMYLRSLMRTQLWLALTVVGVLVLLLGVLPYLFVSLPGLRDGKWGGVPVPWLVLGVAVYPVILAFAHAYLRQAQRNERDFTDMVERS